LRREAVESLSLEIFKSCVDMCAGLTLATHQMAAKPLYHSPSPIKPQITEYQEKDSNFLETHFPSEVFSP